MNQGRIWTVVSPSVGLPLMLGAVAVTAVIVHLAILTHTTWFPGYWEGRHVKAAELSAPVTAAPMPFTVTIG